MRASEESPLVYDEFAPYFDALVAASDSSARQGELIIDILRRVGLTGSASILDLGCGPGRVLAHLASRTEHLLSGLDSSRIMINLARERVPNALLCVGSWLHAHELLEQRCPFDAVYSLSLSLAHAIAEDVPMILGRVFEMLRSTGLFLLDVRPWVTLRGGLIREPDRLEGVWRHGAHIHGESDSRWIDDRCFYRDRRQYVEYRVSTAGDEPGPSTEIGRYTVSYNTLTYNEYASVLERVGFRCIEVLQVQEWPYLVIIAHKYAKRGP